MVISYIKDVITADGIQIYTHIRIEDFGTESIPNPTMSNDFALLIDDGNLILDNLIQQGLQKFNNKSASKISISSARKDMISLNRHVVVELYGYDVCLFTYTGSLGSIPSDYQLANIDEIENLLGIRTVIGNVICC